MLTELPHALTDRGNAFKNDCGTDLLAHLIDATYQHDPVQVVRRVLGLLEGLFAVSAMLHDQAEHLIGAQLSTDLWLGLDEQAICVSSELASMERSEDRLIQLVDGDVVDLHLGQCSITDREARPVHRPELEPSLQDWGRA